MKYSREVMNEMRDWLMDCGWDDITAEDIEEMSDAQVRAAVKRHYVGGVTQFVTDQG